LIFKLQLKIKQAAYQVFVAYFDITYCISQINSFDQGGSLSKLIFTINTILHWQLTSANVLVVAEGSSIVILIYLQIIHLFQQIKQILI